jgi:hypothetical protein
MQPHTLTAMSFLSVNCSRFAANAVQAPTQKSSSGWVQTRSSIFRRLGLMTDKHNSNVAKFCFSSKSFIIRSKRDRLILSCRTALPCRMLHSKNDFKPSRKVRPLSELRSTMRLVSCGSRLILCHLRHTKAAPNLQGAHEGEQDKTDVDFSVLEHR